MNRREFLKRAAFLSAGIIFFRQSNAAALPTYFITDKCVGCETCYDECPHQAIDNSTVPLKINQDWCSHCGHCYEVCPSGAIIKK